jgi:hypothetical protein
MTSLGSSSSSCLSGLKTRYCDVFGEGFSQNDFAISRVFFGLSPGGYSSIKSVNEQKDRPSKLNPVYWTGIKGPIAG